MDVAQADFEYLCCRHASLMEKHIMLVFEMMKRLNAFHQVIYASFENSSIH